MLFSKQKSLSELIADFKDQREIREAKIHNKLIDLQADAGRIRAAIETETNKMVEAELNSDESAAEKARVAIRKHNEKLTDKQNLIGALTRKLQNNVANTPMLEKIREAASRERAARLEKVKAAIAEKSEIQRQIQELQDREKHLDQELSRLRMDAEVSTLQSLLSQIEPRAAALPMHHDRDRWLRHWIQGELEAAEAIITRHEETMQARQVDTHKGKTIIVIGKSNPVGFSFPPLHTERDSFPSFRVPSRFSVASAL